jgi:hypothetical protein
MRSGARGTGDREQPGYGSSENSLRLLAGEAKSADRLDLRPWSVIGQSEPKAVRSAPWR